jgi:apolipoprotein N-acyltransferase
MEVEMAFSLKIRLRDAIALGIGVLAYAFMGWRYNMALAAFVAPAALVFFFRKQKHWYEAFIAYPLLCVVTGFLFVGAWDLEPLTLVAGILIRPALLVLPLLIDHWAKPRLPAPAAGLVLPALMVAIDYALSFSPFSTTLSGAVGLYGFRELAQLASLLGIWGLSFLLWWTATALAALVEAGWDIRAVGAAAILPLAALAAATAFGAARIAADPWGAPTVRVAGVSAVHPRDYWDLVSAGSPRDAILRLRPEAAAIEEGLFAASDGACAAGAKVILWSEGAAILDEENEGRFVERAAAFAKEHRIYLAAAVLSYRFGSSLSGNKVLMLTPEGRLAFSYTKTVSWFPTDSDGAAKVVETPYGRLGTAICFDMDDPRLGRRLAAAGADIVLVPAYDSAGIRPFHSEVGLFRAIENGYSVFRQVTEGASMAVDGRGQLRAFQDYFSTGDRVMLADLPTRGARPLAPAIGDLVAWLDLVLLGALIVLALRSRSDPAPASRRARAARPPVSYLMALKCVISKAIR